MSFAAQMRIGSLEVLLALVVFGIFAGTRRLTQAPATPTEMLLEVAVRGQVVPLKLSEGHPARVIGRSSDADLVLSDPEVSRRHAALAAAGGVVYLSDLGSRNGTFLNGKQLGREGIELKIGDHIDVGNTRLEIAGAEPSS